MLLIGLVEKCRQHSPPGNPDLGTDLDLILLDNCDVNSVIAAPQVAGSSEQITQTLAAGTYYLIVDGYQSADINNYTLLVENLTPQGDLCGDRSNVTTSLQCGATVSFTPSSQNLDTHCGQDGYTGAERIYQINWDGGR
ncbi:MAG: PPC domain-containing protein, partial [Bacteroidota bacterium]